MFLIFLINSYLDTFVWLFPHQAHDKLEEGRKQVETPDTAQLAREVKPPWGLYLVKLKKKQGVNFTLR